MRRARDPITDLRRAIDALPSDTRRAMLEGIRAHPIVAGAYTDGRGGVCPMLAAHRHGGRTTLLCFARSWDRFARARVVRRATRRELAILESQLTASLLASERVDLEGAIADHVALRARRGARADGDAAGRTHPEIVVRRLRPGRPALRRRAARRSGPPAAAGPAARTAW